MMIFEWLNVWTTAWIISLLLAGGVWFCARRAGLGWAETVLLAVAFFPSPLFVAMGGSNSFIYAFDFAVPFALWLAWRRWTLAPRSARSAALLFILGAGVAPLVVLALLADRMNLLYSAINCYRLAGAMGLMCILSGAARRLDEDRSWMVTAFSWMNLVLLVATVLQSRGLINSNVFYSVTDDSTFETNESMRFITAGLFRGSLGIIGTLGWVAFLAQYNVRGPRGLLALAGGVAGVMVVILCGSKTSLLAVLFITLVGCVVFPQMLRHLWGRLTLMTLALTAVGGLLLLRMDTDYFSYTLGVLGLANDSLGTLSFRQERWAEAMAFIDSNSSVLIGFATPFGSEERGLSFFHNEYITLLMGGGIWSAGAYLIGMYVVAREAFRQRLEAENGRVFAALTLLCGLTQAVTVNHLMPGIFFLCTATVTACAYGLGFAERAAQLDSNWVDESGADLETETDHEFAEPTLTEQLPARAAWSAGSIQP